MSDSVLVLASIDPPQRCQMGASGSPPIPFYADCADCRTKEPVIHGAICDRDSKQIAIMTAQGRFGTEYRLCLFCEACYQARLAVLSESGNGE